ncbi:putative ATP-dependent RNA helicase DDX10 isoform X4 [Lampetra fluviatilis]
MAASRERAVQDLQQWKEKDLKKRRKLQTRRKAEKRPEYVVEQEAIAKLTDRYAQINVADVVKFSDFPLSKKTLKGLQNAEYRLPTEIQRRTVGLALQGQDVLGAAKTGSGKTLAFLIPALECLYRKQWTADDGLGVLIISPTRELAFQTFEVLRKVGKYHEFSAGLIIGGKDVKEESERIHRTNVIICTPGRLLQHMDETSYFYANNLQLLVLDEADRILDLGFAVTVNAVVENLPAGRQTLLFSATQTKSVRDLARLSLRDPAYVWVHEQAKYSTPATLEQNYVVCELHQKVNMLYSFIKSHLTKKVIVFFSSCKQVQFLFHAFCRLRPGMPILALHGKQQQMKRMDVYQDFCRKKSAALFATDIAARGLDFPAVSWVLQFDCPEDASTYIHRAGRTARYQEDGEALLMLLPSEEAGMVKQLQERKVPINKIRVNPDKLKDVRGKLEGFLAQEKELKERAQRCFMSYLRAVYLMKNKEVFDVTRLPLPQYALSLGLAVAPRIRFLQREAQQRRAAAQKEAAQCTLGTEGASTKAAPQRRASEEGASDSETELNAFREHLRQGAERGHSARGGPATTTTTTTTTSTTALPPHGSSSSEEDEEEGGDTEEEDDEEAVDAARPPKFSLGQEEDDDDDDEGAELLSVKRRDVFGVRGASQATDDVEDEVTSQKQERRAGGGGSGRNSRVREAKRVLKKKLKVNTRVLFTDEGEKVQAWPPMQSMAALDDDEDDDDGGLGGIDVQQARKRLHREDKVDKELYREKVKKKHREQRLRAKEERRALSKRGRNKDEAGTAVLGRSDDSDDEREDFDPSTLPDPDKYRDEEGEKRGVSDEGDSSSQESGEDGGEPKTAAMATSRDRRGTGPLRKRRRAQSNDDDDDDDDAGGRVMDTGLSLAEDEELVLHLLRQ